MSNELIIEIGRALYGDVWQSALARDLGVNDRTVRHWVSGRNSPRAGVYDDLTRLCEEKAEALRKLAGRMKTE